MLDIILQKVLIKQQLWAFVSAVSLCVSASIFKKKKRMNSGQQAYAADFITAPHMRQNNTQPNQLPDASVYYRMIINCDHHYLQRHQSNSSSQQRGNTQFCCCITLAKFMFKHPFLLFFLYRSEVYLWHMGSSLMKVRFISLNNTPCKHQVGDQRLVLKSRNRVGERKKKNTSCNLINFFIAES